MLSSTKKLINIQIQIYLLYGVRHSYVHHPHTTYNILYIHKSHNKNKYYAGLTENSFKTRYNAHTNSFRQQNKRHSTTLSQYVWTLKDQGISYNIKWRVLAKGSPYAPSAKSCNLCLKEKYIIICKPHLATLNVRNELASACRHRRKYLLYNYNYHT